MTNDIPETTETKGTIKKTKLGKSMGWLVEEPFCPVCDELGFREELHEVTGLEEVAKNPQAAKGAPRVIDCIGGCRFGLEPYYNPKSDGSFCYMLLNSKRAPELIVNHYWYKPDFIKRAK